MLHAVYACSDNKSEKSKSILKTLAEIALGQRVEGRKHEELRNCVRAGFMYGWVVEHSLVRATYFWK